MGAPHPPPPRAESLLRLAPLERLKKKLGVLEYFLVQCSSGVRKGNFLAEILGLNSPLPCCQPCIYFCFKASG